MESKSFTLAAWMVLLAGLVGAGIGVAWLDVNVAVVSLIAVSISGLCLLARHARRVENTTTAASVTAGLVERPQPTVESLVRVALDRTPKLSGSGRHHVA